MKVILASLLAAIVIAVGAALILNTTQRPAYEVFKGAGADVRDYLSNRVRPNVDRRDSRRRLGARHRCAARAYRQNRVP